MLTYLRVIDLASQTSPLEGQPSYESLRLQRRTAGTQRLASFLPASPSQTRCNLSKCPGRMSPETSRRQLLSGFFETANYVTTDTRYNRLCPKREKRLFLNANHHRDKNVVVDCKAAFRPTDKVFAGENVCTFQSVFHLQSFGNYINKDFQEKLLDH